MPPADITIAGCDDSTRLFDVELTADELALLGRIADLTVQAAADGCCMPTLRVEWAPQTVPAGETCVDCYGPLGAVRNRNHYGEWTHTECPAATPSAETGA